MANPYPIEIADAGDGSVKVAGKATFTDPSNQPGGGSQTVELLGPFAVTYQTANLENPGDSLGAVVTTLPAKTLLLAVWLDTTTPWADEADINEVTISLASNATLLDVATNAGHVINVPTTYSLIQEFATHTAIGVWCKAAQALSVAFFTGNPMSAGAGNVYALVATVA